jgi:serine/threonine-protein kinase
VDNPLGAGWTALQASVYKITPTAQSKAKAARALKVVPFVGVDAKGKLEREAEFLKMSIDENVINCFEHWCHKFAEGSGLYCLALELCTGGSVQDILDERAGSGLDLHLALRIVIHTLKGLASAHSSKIVHRDIKPDNLVCASAELLLIKVLDFAAATEKGGMRDTLQRGTGGLAAQIGTVHYMSPEAFGKGTVDARTDIWSVGVTFFQLLTGKLPFDGEEGEVLSEIEVAMNVNSKEKPDYDLLKAAGVTGQTVAIIKKALEKKRDGRYSTAAEMLKEVEAEEADLLLDKLSTAIEDNVSMDDFDACLKLLDSTKAQLEGLAVLESYPQAIGSLPTPPRRVYARIPGVELRYARRAEIYPAWS